MSSRQAAIDLLNETRDFYYDTSDPENWKDRGNKSNTFEGLQERCWYSSDSGTKHCAIGRLDPAYKWTERASIGQEPNATHAIELLGERGIVYETEEETGDEYNIIQYLRKLQWVHDSNLQDVKSCYDDCMKQINQLWPEHSNV